MARKFWYVILLCLIGSLVACTRQEGSTDASLPRVSRYTQSDANSEQVAHRENSPTTIPSHTSTPTDNENGQSNQGTQPTETAQTTPTPTSTGNQGNSQNSTQGNRDPSKNYGYGTPPAPTALEQQLIQRLLTQMNRQRTQNGLTPFALDRTLSQIARMHTWAMVVCGQTHTCQHEPSPCERILNIGHQWHICGESLGQNSFNQSNPWQSVQSLQQNRLDEQPAVNAHESNLLNRRLHYVGISIYIYQDHTVWLTEDFAG